MCNRSAITSIVDRKSTLSPRTEWTEFVLIVIGNSDDKSNDDESRVCCFSDN
jgi:hypothetical protein